MSRLTLKGLVRNVQIPPVTEASGLAPVRSWLAAATMARCWRGAIEGRSHGTAAGRLAALPCGCSEERLSAHPWPHRNTGQALQPGWRFSRARRAFASSGSLLKAAEQRSQRRLGMAG